MYRNAQARKIRHFEGFKCRAAVICPTEEERKKRDSNRQREEGIFIPDEAVYEMKGNHFLLFICVYIFTVFFVICNVCCVVCT